MTERQIAGLDNLNASAPYLRDGAHIAAKTNNPSGRAIVTQIAEAFFSSGPLPSNFDRKAHAFGYVALGPLLLGFAKWLHLSARAHGTRRLGFLTREGPVFREAYDVLFPDSDIRLETVFASRRIARNASFTSRTAIDRVPLGARRGQYRDLADFLQVEFGLPPTGVDEDAIVVSGFRSKEDAIGPETPLDQLTDVVARHAALILEASAKSRQTLRAYLSSLALSDANSALVDIGYAGQIQTTFSEVLETDLAGYYLATFSASKNDTKSLPMAGYLAQSAKASDKAIGICRHRRLYETLLCAPGPSYIGLDRQPSGWVGLADITTETPVRDAFVAEAHRGAIAFVSDYAAGGDAKEAVSPTVATAFLDAALDRPTPELAAWLGEMEFEDRLDRSTLRRLVSTDPDAPSSLWREGQRALNIPERAGHDSASVAWAAFGPYGVLGWRHALTPIVARFIEKRGDVEDAQDFRDNPIRFFRRLSNQRYRKIGRLLYPWD